MTLLLLLLLLHDSDNEEREDPIWNTLTEILIAQIIYVEAFCRHDSHAMCCY